MEYTNFVYLTLLSLSLCLVDGSPGDEFLPKASHITWSSFNFKTILKWGPTPINHSYTVELSRAGMDGVRNPHCIRSMETVCDVTNELSYLRGTYTAEVVSEPLPGSTTDLDEFPSSRSKKFCPYDDTVIGAPLFKIEVSEDKTKMKLLIEDSLAAIYEGGKPMNMRDIFKKDLKYKISYSKAGSTGKREIMSDLSQRELTELDKGQSYCFRVAAYIASRKEAKRLGDWSLPKCSPREHKSIFEEYGLVVTAGGLLIIVAFVVTVIVIIVTCCKRAKGVKHVKGSVQRCDV